MRQRGCGAPARGLTIAGQDSRDQPVKLTPSESRLLAQAERDAALDDVLSEWHAWQLQDRVGRGFANKSLVAGDYRISRQWDDLNGALDDDLDAMRMHQVDFEVTQLADPWRSAIYALARSASTGTTVVHSPRVPPEQRVRVLAEARVRLHARLRAAGVL